MVVDCLVQLEGGKWRRRQVTLRTLCWFDDDIFSHGNLHFYLQVSMQNGEMTFQQDEKEVGYDTVTG